MSETKDGPILFERDSKQWTLIRMCDTDGMLDEERPATPADLLAAGYVPLARALAAETELAKVEGDRYSILAHADEAVFSWGRRAAETSSDDKALAYQDCAARLETALRGYGRTKASGTASKDPSHAESALQTGWRCPSCGDGPIGIGCMSCAYRRTVEDSSPSPRPPEESREVSKASSGEAAGDVVTREQTELDWDVDFFNAENLLLDSRDHECLRTLMKMLARKLGLETRL